MAMTMRQALAAVVLDLVPEEGDPAAVLGSPQIRGVLVRFHHVGGPGKLEYFLPHGCGEDSTEWKIRIVRFDPETLHWLVEVGEGPWGTWDKDRPR